MLHPYAIFHCSVMTLAYFIMYYDFYLHHDVSFLLSILQGCECVIHFIHFPALTKENGLFLKFQSLLFGPMFL